MTRPRRLTAQTFTATGLVLLLAQAPHGDVGLYATGVGCLVVALALSWRWLEYGRPTRATREDRDYARFLEEAAHDKDCGCRGRLSRLDHMAGVRIPPGRTR